MDYQAKRAGSEVGLVAHARPCSYQCGRGQRRRASHIKLIQPQAPSPRSPSKVTVGLLTRDKPLIFISYSHSDRKWVDRLIVHLKPLERNVSFDVWDDSRIRPGSRWHCEIDLALRRAAVAILLVSANYLASDFVMDEEVPTLLRNAGTRGTIVIPLLVTPSLFLQSSLRDFEAINSVEFPLSKLSVHKRDEVLVKLAIAIGQLA